MGGTLERIAPTAGACGAEHQSLAALDVIGVDLRRQLNNGAVGADQVLGTAPAGPSATDAPGADQRAVVVNGEFSWAGEQVDLLDAGTAAVQSRAARITHGDVALDHDRVIGLGVLRRRGAEHRPPRVTVEPVADRPAGDPAE